MTEHEDVRGLKLVLGDARGQQRGVRRVHIRRDDVREALEAVHGDAHELVVHQLGALLLVWVQVHQLLFGAQPLDQIHLLAHRLVELFAPQQVAHVKPLLLAGAVLHVQPLHARNVHQLRDARRQHQNEIVFLDAHAMPQEALVLNHATAPRRASRIVLGDGCRGCLAWAPNPTPAAAPATPTAATTSAPSAPCRYEPIVLGDGCRDRLTWALRPTPAAAHAGATPAVSAAVLTADLGAAHRRRLLRLKRLRAQRLLIQPTRGWRRRAPRPRLRLTLRRGGLALHGGTLS